MSLTLNALSYDYRSSLRDLKLRGMATAYQGILARPHNEHPEAHELLARLIEAEAQERHPPGRHRRHPRPLGAYFTKNDQQQNDNEGACQIEIIIRK